jgi:peptidoglycan/LPS O-acetylase OafA/YrhL
MKFYLKLILLTVILLVLTAGYLYILEPGEDMWFWASLSYYFVLGLVIGWKSQKAVLSKSNSRFFAGVMGSIGIRMLLCVVFLAIYLMISDLKSNEFVVYYLILYLFYTIFEIYQLVSKLRLEKETKVDNATP